jgi:hypothetical protein
MPFISAAGGGTGLLVALVVGGYGLHLWYRGGRPGGNPEPGAGRPH